MELSLFFRLRKGLRRQRSWLHMNNYLPFTILSLSFAAGITLTVWVRRLLIRQGLFDEPNTRSLHADPVPRGGGLAILAIVIPSMIATALIQHDILRYAGLIMGVLVLAFISWLDDRQSNKGGAGVIMRLSLHLFAACLGSLAFPSQETLFGGALPFELDRALMIVGWVWFMNLYNFMDGIDGITCSETISLATGACVVMAAIGHHDMFLSVLSLILAGVCLGFLALNWYPAKIFMGDIGSVPLGFLTGYLLLVPALKGFLIPVMILPLYYIADSGITLLKRLMRGEKIWQAHREHFYQRAALGAKRHDTIVYWIVVANAALIFAALLAIVYPWYGSALAVAIVAFLLWRMHKKA